MRVGFLFGARSSQPEDLVNLDDIVHIFALVAFIICVVKNFPLVMFGWVNDEIYLGVSAMRLMYASPQAGLLSLNARSHERLIDKSSSVGEEKLSLCKAGREMRVRANMGWEAT